MRYLGIDIETYSSVDIKNGVPAYVEAPDFEVLLIAYKFSDDPEVHVVDLATGEEEPYELIEALTDPAVIKTAYNASFERTCLAKWYGEAMPPGQWRCTMILAAQLGLPRSLADVGRALGLSEEEAKLKTGAQLIRYFCVPCKPTKANGGRKRNLPIHAPEKWALFKEYNARDVVAEQAILDRLRDFAPDDKEQALWTLDQEINDRGVLMDVEMARAIVREDEQRAEAMTAEAVRLTHLPNPNSVTQLKEWLKRKGYEVDSLTKADIEDLLKNTDLPKDVRRVLEIRQALGKASVKKFTAVLNVTSKDGRARQTMQFYGGHTGRWSGKGLQVQNLARNEIPDEELDLAHELVKEGRFDDLELIFGEPAHVFSQLVRTAFIPSPGRRFVVSDFSAIEARVLAWLAGEKWRLDVFENGGDIYCETASQMYGVPVEKHGVNGHLRQKGKVAELACGYGGAVGALKAMDSSGAVPEEEMPEIVRKWRTSSPAIVGMWYDFQEAALAVVSGDKTAHRFAKYAGVTFKREKCGGVPLMRIVLPSGRPISYWDPRVEDGERGPRLTYMSQNQTTRKWERTETYYGKITENVVQSIARDCLAEKMFQLTAQGYEIAFHVHDELVLDVPRSDTRAPEIIDRVMGEPIDWAPGLPLKGGTYDCEFYRKD